MKKRLILITIVILIIIEVIHISVYKSINSSYSMNANLIQQIKSNRKSYVSIEQVPENFKKALINMEDRRFYKHFGFDVISIGRAFYINVKYGNVKQGGSTITQQLAKNLFLSNERNFTRKIKELFLAIDLEKKYSKDEILEMYVNVIYYGQNAYGLGEASKIYFNKNVDELSLNQCAMLAGIIQAPSIYNPTTNLEQALKRQSIVLGVMNSNGQLDKTYKAEAKNKVIVQE